MNKLKLILLTLPMLLWTPVATAEMPVMADDFEHDAEGSSVPLKPFNPFNREPTSKGVKVVGESQNPAGTGHGLEFKDDSSTEYAYVEYEFTRVTDDKKPGSGSSTVRVDLNFAPLSTSGDGSSHILLALGEHPMIRGMLIDEKSSFLDCRLKDDGTIDFYSSSGPDSTGHKLKAKNNSLSIFANDLGSRVTYTGLDDKEYVLPADSVAYWLNGSLINFGNQAYTDLENCTLGQKEERKIRDSVNNIARFGILSGNSHQGLHYVFDDIFVADLDFVQSTRQATSSLVFEGKNGLEYKRFPNKGESKAVNTVPDYSGAGYKGGGVAIPFVAETVRVRPSGGDDKTNIQKAIDDVSKLPLKEDGFRGAVVLEAGDYTISETLLVGASGVVVRGAGSQEYGGTTITIKINDDVFRAGKPESVEEDKSNEGPAADITDNYVPVGAKSFRVSDPSRFKVGDRIIINNRYNDKWIADIGMKEYWKAGYYARLSKYARWITAIEGKTLSIHSPVVHAIQKKYGGGQVFTSDEHHLENIGIEGLRVVREPSITENGSAGVKLYGIRNGWVRQVTAVHFNGAGVRVGSSEQVTVEDGAFLDPRGTTIGGQRYSFSISGTSSHILFQRCLTRGGRHDFVSGKQKGPNVWVDCRATETWSASGPHHRYSTGELYDNIMSGALEVKSRAKWNNKKTHGWTGAQVMFWNCDARTLLVETPKAAMNWAVGSTERRITGGDDNPDVGMWDSENQPVTPRSLYYAQLADRLGVNALNNVILPQQKAGHIWSDLFMWDGDGVLGDDVVLWADEEKAALAGTPFKVQGAVRKLVMLDRSPKISWRKVSGPGETKFSDSSLQPMVTCSQSGTYKLEMTVDDGVAPASATVTVTVN